MSLALVLTWLLLACLVGTNPSKETCFRRRVALTVRRQNCRPMRLLTYSCAGRCRSYSMVAGGLQPSIERHCQCCQEMGEADLRVPLLCRDPLTRTRVMAMTIVRYPTSCLCRPCGANAEPEPLEISEYSNPNVLPIGIRSPFQKRDAFGVKTDDYRDTVYEYPLEKDKFDDLVEAGSSNELNLDSPRKEIHLENPLKDLELAESSLHEYLEDGMETDYE